MNQREAVYTAVVSVVGTTEFNGPVQLSKQQKDEVHEQVIQLFLSGQVELRNSENRTEEYIRKYVPGLVNNWVRKDTRLNGGGKYQTKNPGIRAGAGDETMKAMKALLASTKDASARKLIEDEIAKRTAELKPKKTINIDALPAHLRGLAAAFGN